MAYLYRRIADGDQPRSCLRVALATGLLASLLCGVAMAQEDILGRALEDLQSGNPRAAYERLASVQSQRAGEVDYDLVLGLSALDAGRVTEAIFALERVLALRPNDMNARVAMGRAHLALEETDAARREFRSAQALSDSPRARAIIQRYLTTVEQIEANGKFSARFYVEIAGGYDSNVNSASSVDQVAIPALGGVNFTISEDSRARQDAFISFGGGVNFRNRLSKQLSLVGGLSLMRRLHFSEIQYEPSSYDGSLGLTHSNGANFLGATLQYGVLNINHSSYSSPYRESMGGTLQWVRNISSSAQWSSYYQFADLRYPGQSTRNAHRHIVGAALAKGFDAGVTAYAGFYGGAERVTDGQLSALGHKPWGIRLGGDYVWSNRVSLFANTSYENRRYGGEDTYFLVTRRDDQYASAIGFNYALERKGWRVSPQLSHIRVRSNIPTNTYDRVQAQVTIRGEF